ncbi:MAG TPA: galactosyltransferase-related protein [Thermoanaerobaculia bacterium]|nr:galactosyltransferase-related protein [Thermoanaerobaculia bacterium]
MTLRTKLGALVYDVPRFVRSLRGERWLEMHNRNERITRDAHGVRCEWEFTSDLHIATVYPAAGAMLLRIALRRWPIVRTTRNAEMRTESPRVTIVIGHRGFERLPHLLATIETVAAQTIPVECIVVEQDVEPRIASQLPPWVRHLFTPCDTAYNRSAAFNAGVTAARAPIVILHDNDMLAPAAYAAECVARANDGFDFLELKRFVFYLGEEETARVFASRDVPHLTPATVVQNAVGASTAARRDAYFDAGGFDEGFVGWGGEDNEFWERAEISGRANRFGYLPFIHLYHPPQRGKADPANPAIARYYQIRAISPEKRRETLRNR